jgi:transcriptional regulator with XRE-family HTH domain
MSHMAEEKYKLDDSNTLKRLGKLLKIARRKRGHTQFEASVAMNVSRGAISNWEMGLGGIVSENLAKIIQYIARSNDQGDLLAEGENAPHPTEERLPTEIEAQGEEVDMELAIWRDIRLIALIGGSFAAGALAAAVWLFKFHI